MKSLRPLLLAGVLLSGDAVAADPIEAQTTWTPEQMTWSAGPDALPAGAEMSLLEGDPTKAGPFTMRVRLPDGWSVPAHTHPVAEHITVVSGTFVLGYGDKIGAGTQNILPAGSFALVPPLHHHYATASGETVVQIHGLGPWIIEYVDPNDDPRNVRVP